MVERLRGRDMEDLFLTGLFGDRAHGNGFGPGAWLMLGGLVLVLMLFTLPRSGSAAGRGGTPRIGMVLAAAAGIIVLYLLYLQFHR
jgi:hypothetical protein